jgi:thiol-disulfide isomerase/thioredoxin
MRHLAALALVLALAGSAARAQEIKQPKEINAKGWINAEEPSLEKFKGKVVIVEFWATWCPPCRASIPHLIDLRNKLDKSKVEIIGLTDEPLNKIEKFVKDMKMNYIVGYGSTSIEAYGVKFIPHAFVIGPAGRIAWDGSPTDPAMEPLVAKLAEAVKKK